MSGIITVSSVCKWAAQDTARHANAQFYGFLVDLLPVLFSYAGIDAALQYYGITDNAGGELVNGTWTGAS